MIKNICVWYVVVTNHNFKIWNGITSAIRHIQGQHKKSTVVDDDEDEPIFKSQTKIYEADRELKKN